MEKIILVLAGFFFTVQISAQKHDFGKVTKEELAQKHHPRDTSSVAAILFKKARTYFKYAEKNGFTSYTEVELKVKIYKKEGFEWADIEIPYYTGYENLEDEYVEILSATTYNLINNKIEKDKVTSQGKFNEQVNEFWSKKKLSFPNVKEGSIIEIKYQLKTENITVLPEFQFQYKIPVDYAELTTEIPEYYLYKAFVVGIENISTDQKMTRTTNTFETKVSRHNETVRMTYNQIVTKYFASEVAPIIEEEYVNNIENYYGKIQQELQTIRLPNEPPKQMSNSWTDVARTIYQQKEFGEELRKFEFFMPDLKLILKDNSSEKEKIKAVFKFVQQRMNWNTTYGYYTKKGIEIAYQEKTGNIAEINFILVSMLRMAGIQANPVLISTRENGMALFPNKTFFNYVICAISLADETILLDASEKYTDLNVLPIRTLNFSGRSIEANNASNEINLMPTNNSIDLVNILAEIQSDGLLTGKIKEQYYDYNALWFRAKFGIIEPSSKMDYIEKKYTGIEVSDYELLNQNDLSKPIVENYAFSHNGLVEVIGGKMYFSPLLFFKQAENPFKQEERKYPIDFMFPFLNKFNISIKIPNGYSVESIPQSIAIALPQNKGAFNFNVSSKDNQIQLSCNLEINKSIISEDSYQELKMFYKQIVEKQAEKIVLKKN